LKDKLSWWRQWVKQPQSLWLHKVSFQVHFWIGAAAGVYLALMSVTGSIVIYRDELSRWPFGERIVRLHTNLLLGLPGRFMNGIGGIFLTLLCITGAIIWWPGVKNWRRSLTISWEAQFPRINWDLHSALGYWCFFFVLLWGVSGMYFSFPQWFNALLLLDSSDRFIDQGLIWLSALHFGRFNWLTKAVWAVLGLVPAILAFTGIFICCRRVIYKKPSNPNR
jgi:uncharacterized iron-regulated membrane protein